MPVTLIWITNPNVNCTFVEHAWRSFFTMQVDNVVDRVDCAVYGANTMVSLVTTKLVKHLSPVVIDYTSYMSFIPCGSSVLVSFADEKRIVEYGCNAANHAWTLCCPVPPAPRWPDQPPAPIQPSAPKRPKRANKRPPPPPKRANKRPPPPRRVG